MVRSVPDDNGVRVGLPGKRGYILAISVNAGGTALAPSGAGTASVRVMMSADLDIFAEGSVMEPGTQGIYTLPGSPVAALAGLKSQTVAINAPNKHRLDADGRPLRQAVQRGTQT